MEYNTSGFRQDVFHHPVASGVHVMINCIKMLKRFNKHRPIPEYNIDGMKRQTVIRIFATSSSTRRSKYLEAHSRQNIRVLKNAI